MKIRSCLSSGSLALAFVALSLPAPAGAAGAEGEQAAVDEAATRQAVAEWQALRFGMFIHWGPVSLKGTEIGWSRGAEVPAEEYDRLFEQFNPTAFDAKEWVRLARDSGMKYLVFTSKHHDGFCMWDSAHTDVDIMAAPFKRDVLADLSAACREEGVRFSLYYSILDWRHPDYPMGSPGGRSKKPDPNMPRYFEYVKNQTREIFENYGPLCLWWFDGQWEEPWTQEHGSELYAYLKNLQPSVVINNRVSKGRPAAAGAESGGGVGHSPGDYDTPEQHIGGFNRIRPWETCMTIGQQWSWKPDDAIKSLKECLRTLLRVAGGDGNFLFNVGPMPDGRIEPRQAERLREMGSWLQEFGGCVYGTRGGPFMPGPWGASTCKDDRTFLFVFEWPNGGLLLLPAISQQILAVENLTGGSVAAAQSASGVTVSVPAEDRKEIATVIALTVEGAAFDIAPVAVLRFGRPPLPVASASASNVFQNQVEHGAAKAVDGNEETRWATDAGPISAWLEVDLGEPRQIGSAWISEAYGGRVEAFELQALRENGWEVFHSGTALGADALLTFEPVLAQRVRLNIAQAKEGPTISEFQLFAPK